MRLIAALFLTTLIVSCTYKTVPLKGKYSDGNFEAYSDKSKDQVWENIIDFFSKKGLSIKIIDRSSGLIVSGESVLPWSYEDKNGKVEKKDAWVVIQKIIDPGTRKPIMPFRVTGEWNIRIKEKDGKTLIAINLVNPSYASSGAYGSPSKTPTMFEQGTLQSTGNFEKLVYEQIK
jgi:hypothetical protein